MKWHRPGDMPQAGNASLEEGKKRSSITSARTQAVAPSTLREVLTCHR